MQALPEASMPLTGEYRVVKRNGFGVKLLVLNLSNIRIGHFLTLFLNLLICQVGMLTKSNTWVWKDTLWCLT